MATHEHIDGYSLMTYDYAVSYSRHSGESTSTGANAPLDWMRRSVEGFLGGEENPRLAKKILLGLNFYGYSFAPEAADPDDRVKAIVGRQYIEAIEDIINDELPSVIEWEPETSEHRIAVSTNPKFQNTPKTIYFPTLNSIDKRISLAEELGVSLSIWELGQGLPYFYDLL
jgi:chitinase domain-containing protein 1